MFRRRIIISIVGAASIIFCYLLFKLSVPQKYILEPLSKLKVSTSKKSAQSSSSSKSFEKILSEELKTSISLRSVSRVDENMVRVETNENIVILFDPNKDLNYQLNSLQTIITQSRIEKRQLSKIDLRFSKIAVEYRN